MGWPSSALIAGTDTEDPESYAWLLTIPQTEFDGNPNMDPSKDQNPIEVYKPMINRKIQHCYLNDAIQDEETESPLTKGGDNGEK